MAKLRKLWSALEAPCSVAGVRAELKQILGEELAFAEPFLRRLPDPSQTYPCPQIGWRGCPRRVITHPDGRIVAACGCDPPECETLSLRPQDVVRYELDVGLLCKFLGRALGFAVSATRLAGKRSVWNAGLIRVDGITRLPVWLILAASRAELRNTMDSLLATYEGPFVALVPTLRFVDASLEGDLRRRKARLIALQDAVVIDNGKLSAPRDLPGLLGAAAQGEVPAKPKRRYRAPRSIGSEEAVQAVQSYMRARGWSITVFANQCGTTGRAVHKFFKTHEIRRSLFEAMANQIGVTVEELLHGELPPKYRR